MELFKTPLGEMKVVDVLLYYDRPFIFHCKDIVDSQYIVHLIDDDDDGEHWFMVPSSSYRIECVRIGKISLRDSILFAEHGWIWEVTTPYNGDLGKKIKRLCASLGENDLPDEDLILSFPSDSIPSEIIDPEQQAKQSMRNVLLISLDDGEHSSIMSASNLGSILLRTQSLINALGQTKGSIKGRLPMSVIDETSFNYTGSFVASVGIKLEAKHSKLFDPSVEESLERMVALIGAGSSKELLTEILKEIPLRATARYRFLLQALGQAQVSFKTDWGSPHKGRKTAHISHLQISETINILDLEGDDMVQRITLNGDLIGIMADKKKGRSSFEFISSDGDRFKGYLSLELLEKVDDPRDLHLANNITVVIEETIEINPATSEERITYVLVEISDM